MWSSVLILATAQLCVGLPHQKRQEQVEEVDILKGATVNCKVSATVTYPEATGGDELPSLKCDTKCSFNTNEKNKMYFLGYAYRHFDRLEREYGLMVEIRYNKGTTKGCKLVPAATNDEVFFKHEGTHLENPMEDDSDQTSLIPDAELTVIPAEHPVENDSEQTSLLPIVESTVVPSEHSTENDSEQTSLPPDAESTAVPGESSIENETKQKSVPPNVPPTVMPAKLSLKNDTEQATLSSIEPSSSLVTEFQANHDSESTALSFVEQSTAVPTEHPTKEDSEQTILSDIAPSTVVPKELSKEDDSVPTALSSIAPSAELSAEPSLKHEPNPIIRSTIIHTTEIPTKQSVKSESKPIIRSTVQQPTILSTELPKNEDHDPSIMSSMEPPTSMPSEKEPTADNNKIDSSPMMLPTNDQQNDVSSDVFTEPTPTLFSHFEVSSLDSTTLLDEEPKWVLIGTAYFHISRVRGDWKKGKKYCEGIGATLASIRTQEEQDGLADLLPDDAWIGLHDMQKEDEHIWEDHSEISYTKWQPGEPANGYFWFFQLWGEEDCVEMREYHYFRWNDQDCHKHNLYICRRDNETLAGTNESLEGTYESLESTEVTDLFDLFLG